MPINKHEILSIPDLKIFDLNKYQDQRGTFLKIYSKELGMDLGQSKAHEIFYNVSNKNSLRGMHFLAPPFSSHKLVHCLSGSVLDVVLDLRKDSPMFKRFLYFTLSAERPQALLIPPGCAHGFLSLEDNSTLIYFQNANYQPEKDHGILWSSFGFQWSLSDTPLLSERDQSLPSLENFVTPFQ